MTIIWIGLAFVIAIGIYAAAQNNAVDNENRQREISRIFRENQKREIKAEAEKLAAGINTPQEAKALERQRDSKERARDRASINGNAYARLDKEYEVLDKAFDILKFKSFGWFLSVEDTAPEMPLEILKYAGEIIDEQTYKGLEKKYTTSEGHFRYGFEFYGYDSDPADFRSTKTDLALREKIIAFKEILDNAEPEDEKCKALNKMLKGSARLSEVLGVDTAEEYLGLDTQAA